MRAKVFRERSKVGLRHGSSLQFHKRVSESEVHRFYSLRTILMREVIIHPRYQGSDDERKQRNPGMEGTVIRIIACLLGVVVDHYRLPPCSGGALLIAIAACPLHRNRKEESGAHTPWTHEEWKAMWK